ncbi:hypothetical protein [Hymenobacter cavernae]|nr:hypothetical protein [Hymenobacter cavernae]
MHETLTNLGRGEAGKIADLAFGSACGRRGLGCGSFQLLPDLGL